VTDTTIDAWDAGYTLGDDPATITPAAVIPPVTHGVTPPVTGSVTSVGTWGVTGAGDGPVTQAGGAPAAPLGIGHWDEAPGEASPGRDESPTGLFTRLAALAQGSPLLGGSSLAAELADPSPGTWSQHWRHVTRHENLPDGAWKAFSFIAGHLAVTGSLKLTGKAMTAVGNALTWTGTRADRASDRFASAAIFIVLAVAMVAILVIAADEVISYLP
jgi:hypothetical protein